MADPITVTIQNLNSPIATVKVQNKLSESAVTSVNGKIGDVLLTNADIPGVENVNNTSDLNKPISTATQAAIDAISFTGDYSPTGHQHVLADITNAGTAAAANVGDFATASHQHSLSHITNAGTAAASDIGDFAPASHTHVLADITNFNTGNFASSAQGILADSAVQPGDGISSLVNDANYLTGVGDVLTSGSIDTLAKINNILTTPDLIDITDSRLTDARTPTSHASTHTNGTDDIQDATAAQKGLATALQIQKLDAIEALADVTDSANVSGAGAQMKSEKGVANGYASLDGGGKVPASQLPSYVDDVLEYPLFANFPNPGETGKIYVDKSTGKIYRWSGSIYVEISDGNSGPAVTSVNTLTGAVVLDPDDLDDSATTNKFITQVELDKLSGIASGAEVNINSDWNATSGDAEILNKPSFGSMTGANTGDYSLTGHTHSLSDLEQDGAAHAEVIAWNSGSGAWIPSDVGAQSDWDATSGSAEILNKPTFGTMAFAETGDYSQTGHLHSIVDIYDAGSAASRDVPFVGNAADDEVVLGSDTRLLWFEVLGTASYFDVPAVGNAASFEVVKGSDTRLSTNLSYVTSPTTGIVTSSNGTDAVISGASSAHAGLFSSSDFDKLGLITITQSVDLDIIEAASGDMLAATYDPTNISGDAFAMDNMVEGADTKILTSGERDKLSGIASGAEVNVNADWDAVGGDAEILNKPAFGDITGSNIADFATSGQGALADTALQSGDNISLLTNDSLYITSGDIDTLAGINSVIGDATLVTSGYITGNYQPLDPILTATTASFVVADETKLDFITVTGAVNLNNDYATSGQGALADTALQSGDNISLLTNDSGYINFPSVYSYTEETGNYNISTTDYTIHCISGGQTITLPTAVGIQGQVFVVKNSSTGVITITGSQTIDGYDSITTNSPQSLTLQSTNTNWIII